MGVQLYQRWNSGERALLIAAILETTKTEKKAFTNLRGKNL